MLSAAKYPYMNRAYRRNPNSYTAGLGELAVTGSRLLLALLRHAGFMPATFGTTVSNSRPNPIIAGIRQRGKSVVEGLRNLWRKLTS